MLHDCHVHETQRSFKRGGINVYLFFVRISVLLFYIEPCFIITNQCTLFYIGICQFPFFIDVTSIPMSFSLCLLFSVCSQKSRNQLCELRHNHNNIMETKPKWRSCMQCVWTLLQTSQRKWHLFFNYQISRKRLSKFILKRLLRRRKQKDSNKFQFNSIVLYRILAHMRLSGFFTLLQVK